MTKDPPTAEREKPTLDGIAYELAILQKQRCIGFAALLEAAGESGARFESDELDGIARLAKDIAMRADECFDAVRAAGRQARKFAGHGERSK